MADVARTIVIWICCLILLGGAGVGIHWVVGQHVHEMWTYQPVEAEVVAAAIVDGPGRGLNYLPVIAFKYEFGGQTYRCSKYKSSHWASESKSGPQRVVDRYPPGSKHTAWVSPSDPRVAVLERELHWPRLTVFVAVALIPIALLYWFYRYGRRPAARGG